MLVALVEYYMYSVIDSLSGGTIRTFSDKVDAEMFVHQATITGSGGQDMDIIVECCECADKGYSVCSIPDCNVCKQPHADCCCVQGVPSWSYPCNDCWRMTHDHHPSCPAAK